MGEAQKKEKIGETEIFATFLPFIDFGAEFGAICCLLMAPVEGIPQAICLGNTD